MKAFNLEEATLDASDLHQLKVQMINLFLILSVFVAIPISAYFISPEALPFSILGGMMTLGISHFFFRRASKELERIKKENKKIILTGTITKKFVRAKKFGYTKGGLPDTIDHYYFSFDDHEQEVQRNIFKRYEVGQTVELHFALLTRGNIKFEYLKHRLVA